MGLLLQLGYPRGVGTVGKYANSLTPITTVLLAGRTSSESPRMSNNSGGTVLKLRNYQTLTLIGSILGIMIAVGF